MSPEPFDLESKSGPLERNAIRCRNCNAVIESVHSHEFVTCPCGDVSVDGGLDNPRVIAHHRGQWERVR